MTCWTLPQVDQLRIHQTTGTQTGNDRKPFTIEARVDANACQFRFLRNFLKRADVVIPAEVQGEWTGAPGSSGAGGAGVILLSRSE